MKQDLIKIKARHRKSLKVVVLEYNNIQEARLHNPDFTDFEIIEI